MIFRLCLLGFLLFLTLSSGSANAQQSPYWVSNNVEQPLNDHAWILTDADPNMAFADILAAYENGAFRPALGVAAVAGTTQSTWLRIELLAQDSAPGEWVLVSRAISQRHLNIFVQTSDDLRIVRSGKQSSYREGRDINYRHPNIRLDLSDTQPTVIYLQYTDPVGSVFPLQLTTVEHLEHNNLTEHLGFGIIFGIVIGLLLYNFVLLVNLREPMYAWYVFSTSAVLFLLLDGTSFGVQYLFHEGVQPRWADRTSTGALWGFAVALFSQNLLHTKKHTPRLHLLVSALAAICFLTWVSHQLRIEWLSTKLFAPFALIGIIILVMVAVTRVMQGNRTALYFLIGHGVVFLAALIMVARTLGIIDPHDVNTYIFPAAVAFECIIFSLALAHRIQTLQQKHQLAVSASQQDPLTGVLNRRGLDAAFQHIRAKNHGEIGLILLDLNKFKAVNDTHGHDVGDILLQTVAQRIKQAVRDHDHISRLGGDEYAILIHDEDAKAAIAILSQRLNESFTAPVNHRGLELTIDAAIGYAHTRSASDANYATLYRTADQALYRSKQPA
ncbi:MAG: sensor domain-containing diguanylate cyclase [Aliidiomarina sp.]|uniref:diguanylate cyclase n=1 Tax=Aliidiomarina sp. TaxID=1872439 RepID=UPI0025B8FD75|nr:diguanylate cyclase [Aliidiomarina sp.]MCH8500800.1 sensor domain-containing diguanylate cyclase [Aliidiomarina sp.]